MCAEGNASELGNAEVSISPSLSLTLTLPLTMSLIPNLILILILIYILTPLPTPLYHPPPFPFLSIFFLSTLQRLPLGPRAFWMPCCEPSTAIAPMSFGLDAGRGYQLLAEQRRLFCRMGMLPG
jgi:hypothetical protein